jgi:hypothetical protein
MFLVAAVVVVVCGLIGLMKLPFPAATRGPRRRMLADFHS